MNLDDATLAKLKELCSNVEAPWELVPSDRTVTETIILHDANGIAIADLFTEGPATDVDLLIALAPTAIADLVAEVESLRRRLAPPNLCGAYLGDNDGTCPQLTCIRARGHAGLHDNVNGDEPRTEAAQGDQKDSRLSEEK